METLANVWSRAADSIAVAEQARAERVKAGVQPYLPGADFTTLLVANLVYLSVTGLLYKWMQKRAKPFALKSVLLGYNFTCILLAGYCAVGILAHKFKRPGSFACNKNTVDADGQHMAFVLWVFYAQKFWEFMDTWFFILRKSFRQVTFLHLFHHSSITLVVGSILPYDFAGDMFLPALLNSIVHVLMYGHYFVTALGIKSWWSQYLTTLQLAQFVTISAQSYLAWTAGPTCGAADWTKVMMVLYMMSMLVLFGNFFLRKYVLRKPHQDMCGVIKMAEEPTRQHFNGVVTLQKDGGAVVQMPEWFRPFHHPPETKYSYQLTPIGAPMPTLHVSSELDFALRTFTVAGGVSACKVSWQVIAEAPTGVTGGAQLSTLNGKRKVQ